MDIPYFRQEGHAGERKCGAASLQMVYASLGVEVSQEDIWRRIARPNAKGALSSFTHLMARDAIVRGFDAVVVQAKNPLQMLRICTERNLRVILNHRMNKDSSTGHYSVLAGTHRTGVLLHDPLEGGSRNFEFQELIELWRASKADSEIAGNILIAVALKPASPPVAELCTSCDLGVPDHVPCQQCQHPVALRPAAVLGCAAINCTARVWTHLCCPRCDLLFTFHLEKPVPNSPGQADAAGTPAAASGVPGSELPTLDRSHLMTGDYLDADKLYGEIDRLFAQVRGLSGGPEALESPEVREQLQFIASQQDVLRMALAEAVAAKKQRDEEMASFARTVRAENAAHEKRMEDLQTQGPPLDGHKLAMDLVTNLGFVLPR